MRGSQRPKKAQSLPPSIMKGRREGRSTSVLQIVPLPENATGRGEIAVTSPALNCSASRLSISLWIGEACHLAHVGHPVASGTVPR